MLRPRLVTVTFLAAFLLLALSFAVSAGAAPTTTIGGAAPIAVDSTTVAAPTTTPAPPTTLAPATTTLPPATTTVAPTTTTTLPPLTPASSSSSSSTPWGWIIAILVLIAIALIAVMIVLRRSAQRTKQAWQAETRSAFRDAELTRDMLEGEARPDEPEDPTRRTAVQDNVERVATKFEALANAAPNDEARANASSVASSLRGYLFALEAERLLRNAPTTPTADQLATADATRRQRATDLDAALGNTRAYVDPDDQPAT